MATIAEKLKLIAENEKKVYDVGYGTGYKEGKEVPPVLQEKTATENGVVVADDGYDGLSQVTVDVQPTLQEKTVTPTTEAQTIEADEGYDGLSVVAVEAVQTEQTTITTNGTHTPTSGKYFDSVTVNVADIPAVLQEKTITENGEVIPDDGYEGFYKVVVNVPIPEGYIVPEGDLSITANGTYDVTDKASVTVNVPSEDPDLEEITITENGEYIPSGDGYSKVTVAVENTDSAIPIEVATEAEMTALLTSGEVGGVYKYIGETTDTYENDALYVLEATLISFTITGTTYQAEDGMTWAEWVESDYNPADSTSPNSKKVYITGTVVYLCDNGSGTPIATSGTIGVSSSDVIVDGFAYIKQASTGGGSN